MVLNRGALPPGRDESLPRVEELQSLSDGEVESEMDGLGQK